MSKRTARIELLPATYRDSWNKVNVPQRSDLPPSKRPHFLRLVAANGETLAHSETYHTRSNARRAVKAWLEAFFQVGGGDDPECRPVPVVEFDANGVAR